MSHRISRRKGFSCPRWFLRWKLVKHILNEVCFCLFLILVFVNNVLNMPSLEQHQTHSPQRAPKMRLDRVYCLSSDMCGAESLTTFIVLVHAYIPLHLLKNIQVREDFLQVQLLIMHQVLQLHLSLFRTL